MAGEDNKPQAPKAEASAAKESKPSKLKETPKLEEGTVVSMAKLDTNGGKTSNYIWIEGTGESKHLPKGKKFEVQELHGKKLIEKGAAKLTTAPPKPKPAAKKTKDVEEDDD